MCLPGNYNLAVQNRCFKQDFAFSISVDECQSYLWVPNAFTPNNDGTNDCFAPVLSNYTAGTFQITITDRWGNLVFAANTPEQCWDGSFKGTIIQGVYTYRITYRDSRQKYKEKVGTVSVLL